MVNWPYVYHAARDSVDDQGAIDQAAFDDIGWVWYLE